MSLLYCRRGKKGRKDKMAKRVRKGKKDKRAERSKKGRRVRKVKTKVRVNALPFMTLYDLLCPLMPDNETPYLFCPLAL